MSIVAELVAVHIDVVVAIGRANLLRDHHRLVGVGLYRALFVGGSIAENECAAEARHSIVDAGHQGSGLIQIIGAESGHCVGSTVSVVQVVLVIANRRGDWQATVLQQLVLIVDFDASDVMSAHLHNFGQDARKSVAVGVRIEADAFGLEYTLVGFKSQGDSVEIGAMTVDVVYEASIANLTAGGHGKLDPL